MIIVPRQLSDKRSIEEIFRNRDANRGNAGSYQYGLCRTQPVTSPQYNHFFLPTIKLLYEYNDSGGRYSHGNSREYERSIPIAEFRGTVTEVRPLRTH